MLTLRKVTTHPHAQDAYTVHLGEMQVGSISRQTLTAQDAVWRWGFSSADRTAARAAGDAESREAAMADFRAAWDRIITPADIEQMQQRADHTAWKHAIWDIGGMFETADPAGTYRFRKCLCGATLDCWDQAAVMPHVEHIKTKKPRHPRG